ncbi:signal-transducing adaptor protein 1-like [Entelurus aequoreus]|uniref:signal-transducing adaptor protein 1-like n=1 Tax=Entelurus aequoreus TaxID=161455 RepID=UPI002B1DB9A3|nr:signal-transducing adaptor protein 1-like [Entelurus aequoreus]
MTPTSNRRPQRIMGRARCGHLCCKLIWRRSFMMSNPQVRNMRKLPHCYHEGYLEKRSFKNEKSHKLWTCLCGSTLFFFKDKRDTEYLEKLDLRGSVVITDNAVDCTMDAASLNLKTKDITIGLSAPNAEARELWKGFIQSVVELSVSSSLNLLPGLMLRLEDVVEKEKKRLKHVPVPVDPVVEMPNCFHPVSRLEAELLLEREASKGNLLLRPNRDGHAFVISIREKLKGPIYKHYSLSRKHNGSFTIDLKDPVTCASLPDIIKYFMDVTKGSLTPLSRDDKYVQNFSYVNFDNESGERLVQSYSAELVKPDFSTKPELKVKAEEKPKKPPVPTPRKYRPPPKLSSAGQHVKNRPR